MPRLLESDIEILRKYLNAMGFDTLQRILRGSHYFADPWPHFWPFRQKLLLLHPTFKALFEQFLLGLPQGLANMDHTFRTRVVRPLEQLGLAESRSGYMYANGLGLTSFLGTYLWASLPPAYPTCQNLEAPV